jgi:magnesium and cobalt transporter
MNTWLIVAGIAASAVLALLFSTLTYALRDFSRARLAEHLERRGKERYLDATLDHVDDLVFATAVGRLCWNIGVLIGVLALTQRLTDYPLGWQYLIAVVGTAVIHLFFSVAIPHALATHAGETFVALFVGPLHGLRTVLMPVVRLMHLTDRLVARAAKPSDEQEPERLEEEIEQEILSAVEEGEKEGVVDEDERQMIESVIEFHDTHAGQVMTARPEIFALDVNCSLEGVKARIAESGHSRIPVFEGTLDHIVGMLYARDLIKFLGQPAERFNVRATMRPPFFVPETKPLPDLLNDFRLQKVHIAIVLDEYGGTAGLVTIEDIFEELVGDISDEHEPVEPAMLVRQGDNAAEADARIYIGELNRIMGLNIPEDAGYDTLGGFISTALGRIPESGAEFEHEGARYTILEAEPQKVNRVRVEVIPEPVESASPPTSI